ncbi:MAG TPA: hypothetical protein VH595_23400 [Verrucomicrobiae bacterium]|jgi:hypothetical protein|nr:hypothetical protein [Verrucomicrobiae bacterium]
MNTKKLNSLAIGLVAVLGMALSASAQSYSINWYKIAGGGGVSSNGQYSVSGTIGQSDASGAMTGGQYSVTGGFWSMIQVVQTPGTPELTITRSGNSVIISWADTGTYNLQQSVNLSNTNAWTLNGGTVTTAGGSNSVTITPPTGNVFFRLQNPSP